MATQPQLAVKIITNTAELIANLNAGKGAIESYGPSIAKMQETWARNSAQVVEKAATITAAMKDIGVSTLSAGDAAKSLKTLDAALLQLKQSGQPVPPLMQETADKLRAVGDAAKVGVGSGTSLLGTLTKLGGAVGIAFSVGSIVQFGKSVFETAGKINDMASQMGISTDAVQGFKEAAELSGSSLDAVGTAIGKMNANLAGGDKATVKALKDAGLGFNDIRSMKPEDAFLAIADAIQKIDDPMKQVEVGRKLMGKGFDELLPAMKEGFRGVSDAASKMSKETIKALDDAGDAWQRLSNKAVIVSGGLIAATMDLGKSVTSSGKSVWEYARNSLLFGAGAAGNIAVAMNDVATATTNTAKAQTVVAPTIHKTAEELAAAAAASKKYADAFNSMFAKFSGGSATADMKMLDAVFRKMADSGQLTAKQIDAMTKEAMKLKDEGATLTPTLQQMAIVTGAWGVSLSKGSIDVKELGTQIEVLTPKLSKAWQMMNKPIEFGINSLKDELAGLMVRSPADMLKDVLGSRPKASLFGTLFGDSAQIGQDLAATIVGAFQGGGSAIKSAISGLGSSVMGNLGKSLVGTVDAAGPLFNSALGKIFAGALPVVGSLIGPLAGAIWNKLFGTAGRDTKLDMAKAAFGSVEEMQKQLLTLGGEQYNKLWKQFSEVGQNNKGQAVAAIEAITAALAKQKEKTDAVAASAAASAAAQQAALDAISAKYSEKISALESEYKSLSDSVSKEAAEEFMGIVETQERARMDQIAAEKKAQEIMRDAEIAAKQETFDQVLAAGKDTYDELRRIFGKGLDIPSRFIPPRGSADDYDYGYVPSGAPRYSGGGGGGGGIRASQGSGQIVIQNHVNLDGRALARNQVQYIPSALARAGR